jgi:hypothetical protein
MPTFCGCRVSAGSVVSAAEPCGHNLGFLDRALLFCCVKFILGVFPFRFPACFMQKTQNILHSQPISSFSSISVYFITNVLFFCNFTSAHANLSCYVSALREIQFPFPLDRQTVRERHARTHTRTHTVQSWGGSVLIIYTAHIVSEAWLQITL